MPTSKSNIPASTPDHTDMPSPMTENKPIPQWQWVVCVLAILLSFAVCSIWIMQNSINAYYQQTYHRESPLMAWQQQPVWQFGGRIGDYLYQQKADILSSIEQFNGEVARNYNQNYAYTPEYKAYLAKQQQLEKIRLAALAKQQQLLAQQQWQTFPLTKEQQVFFAGDSLMQGVAPFVQQYLQTQYQIKTVNLSKQSTGLTYPSFFDWPKTIEETLKNNHQIKVLVIFLGPNDPWDMPNPQGGQYLKFQSPEWENEYRSRIAKIVTTAQHHQVRIMWLLPPNMRKTTLNQQMIYLNQLFADELKKHNIFTIDTRPLLGGKNNVYSDYLVKDGKTIKMRSADGIHFSADGQRLLAQVIESHLRIE